MPRESIVKRFFVSELNSAVRHLEDTAHIGLRMQQFPRWKQFRLGYAGYKVEDFVLRTGREFAVKNFDRKIVVVLITHGFAQV